MYRIGEFARIAGVSTKTLRFYDEIGLLKPHWTDPVTRYRYYASEQLIALADIVSRKHLGLSLDEIRRRATPERARERLVRALARAQHSLDRLDATLKGGTMGIPIVVKSGAATRVASLGDVVTGYDDVVQAERELLGRVPERLRGTTRGVLWHQCADAGVPGGEPFVEIRPTGRLDGKLDVKELPAVTVACAYAPDDYHAAERTYDAIREWMCVQPNRVRLAGPKRELCFGRTLEIQFPLVGV